LDKTPFFIYIYIGNNYKAVENCGKPHFNKSYKDILTKITVD